jgi:hypothetical protein
MLQTLVFLGGLMTFSLMMGAILRHADRHR